MSRATATTTYAAPPPVLRPGVLSVVGTLVFASATFLLLPCMGVLSKQRHETVEWRPAPEIVPPPPVRVQAPPSPRESAARVRPRPRLQKPERPREPKRRRDAMRAKVSLALNALTVDAGDFALDFPVLPGPPDLEDEPEPPAPEPPPKTVNEPRVYEWSQLDRRPTRLRGGKPVYPARAKRNNIEGYVEILFTITPEGRVTDLRILRADPPNVFEEAGANAVRDWRFTPPMRGKRRVSVRVRQRIRFELQDR